MRRVRQSRPASACSSPYSGGIWCLLTGFLPSSATASIIYLNRHHTSSGQSQVYRVVTQLRTDGVHCRESAGTGPVNLKVVPNEQCCLNLAGHHVDQLIDASLSHTHYWYEVGMLKIPVIYSARTEQKKLFFKAVVKFEHPRIPAFQPFMKPVSYFLRK